MLAVASPRRRPVPALVHGRAPRRSTRSAWCFALWLFAQSTFVIGALCPWCLLVTVSTVLVFCSLTHVNVLEDNLHLPRRLQARARAAVEADLDVLVVAVGLVLLAAVVVSRYGTRSLA